MYKIALIMIAFATYLIQASESPRSNPGSPRKNLSKSLSLTTELLRSLGDPNSPRNSPRNVSSSCDSPRMDKAILKKIVGEEHSPRTAEANGENSFNEKRRKSVPVATS